MKKKVIIFSILMVIFSGFLSAQNLKFKRYNSITEMDGTKNFDGVAAALYLEESDLPFYQVKIDTLGTEIVKLSKENYWLIEKALGEWNLEPGENYVVFCGENFSLDPFIMLLVTISKDSKSYEWRAKLISEEEWE